MPQLQITLSLPHGHGRDQANACVPQPLGGTVGKCRGSETPSLQRLLFWPLWWPSWRVHRWTPALPSGLYLPNPQGAASWPDSVSHRPWSKKSPKVPPPQDIKMTLTERGPRFHSLTKHLIFPAERMGCRSPRIFLLSFFTYYTLLNS